MNIAPASQLLEMRTAFTLDVDPANRRWAYFQADPERAVILPDRMPNVLFRGQSKRFSPCLTSLGRDLWEAANPPRIAELTLNRLAKLTVRLAQRIWFSRELEDHPGAGWLRDQKLKGFEHALAQHYGAPTGLMDLSESFDVACFFATCYCDKEGKWRPCVEGAGVIYLLPTERLKIGCKALQPIGLQILPRPQEQFGWLMTCGLDTDFEDIPGLQLFEFEHDEEVSRYFLGIFSDGKALFPPDAMASVAGNIMVSSALAESDVVSAIQILADDAQELAFTPADIVDEIREKLDFRLEGRVEAFNEELRHKAHGEWLDRRDNFLSHVTMPFPIRVSASDNG